MLTEQNLIRVWLGNPDKLWAMSRLEPEHFSDGFCRWCFESMRKLDKAGTAVDIITLSEFAEAHDQQRVFERLGDMMAMASAPTNMDAYIASLVNEYKKRRLIAVASDAAISARQKGDAQDVIDTLLTEVSGIALGGRNECYTFGDALESAEVEIREAEESRKNGGTAGIPTGLPLLDKRMGGFHRKRSSIIAGRPGWGKTALMLQCSLFGAMRGHPGAILSLEMPKEDLAKRAVCALAGLSYSGLLNGHGLADFKKACAKYRDIPLKIDDCTRKIGDILARAHELKHSHKIEHLWIDYIGLIQGGGASERRDNLAEYSRELQGLSKDLDLSVNTLVQLSRKCEDEKRRPKQSDIADSGDIEKDADIILALNPKDTYRKGVREMEMGWLKSRICSPGWSRESFDFYGDHQQFRQKTDFDYAEQDG